MPGVCSDETIESNHCNFVPSPQTHYGALAGPMRSDIDEIATMTGLDYTVNVLLDTRGRVVEIVGGSHPQAHRRAIERFNDVYAYENPVAEKGRADIAICGVFAPTDHLFFHTGWGCMSADMHPQPVWKNRWSVGAKTPQIAMSARPFSATGFS